MTATSAVQSKSVVGYQPMRYKPLLHAIDGLLNMLKLRLSLAFRPITTRSVQPAVHEEGQRAVLSADRRLIELPTIPRL
jgi:hypothetical protein